MSKRIEHKIINGVELKRCSKCKECKPLSMFSKCKMRCDNLQNQCKDCRKQIQKDYIKNNIKQIREKRKHYYINNKEKVLKRGKCWRENNVEHRNKEAKIYYENNREQIRKYAKEHRKNNKQEIKKSNSRWYKNNIERLLRKAKCYRESNVLFETYCERLTQFEKIRVCVNNPKFLEVKCAYCGKWFLPNNTQVRKRIQSINDLERGECRFYCSENCKQACPIYNQNKWPKGFKQATSREVVPLLRQLVLERDNYTCQKCGATTETAQLHVHHIIPYAQNKMQANDPDSCITLCKECHKKVHQQDGCKYSDLRC